ncbi:hypothetical protein PPERSA_09659 [Pseudocohnilembus persalinus]|uniref:PH domain-containing protein n=1 Tax=Pseudocohnilembus persalinus TaxID=266149 RepID=A0A0V0R729_PSEPJ|nr:hypothetical protein PPERSA_09659 [Pseudocohnilembus persalinus]|eukprot:KRX10275.1 hypothetical protein PPERSA_09659 [Pseudocohnilembus persalinus]
MFQQNSQQFNRSLQNQQQQQQYQEEDGEDDDELIQFDQIEYNRLILEAYQSFKEKDLNQCVKLYQQSLIYLQKLNDIYRQALVQTNLSIILFHNCQYRKAASLLQSTLLLFQNYDRKNEAHCALMIKIYANLCISYIVINKYQDSKDANEQDGYFEGVENKYDGATLACFYSSMGLNRELFKDYSLALNYYSKALKIWQDVGEVGFIVLTLKHLISITKDKNQKEAEQYIQRLNVYLNNEYFEGVNHETLFKDFEKKIQCGSEIAFQIKKLEEKYCKGRDLQQFQFQGLDISGFNNPNDMSYPLWKQAAIDYIKTGDWLTKINKDTNGRPQKYFQVASDNTLRWAAEEKNITNPDKIQFYHLSEIKGLIYGKNTYALRKSYNRKLQSYQCFSLVLKSRTLDFYCDEEQIMWWVRGLSCVIKKLNKQAFVVRPGAYYWKKFKLILQDNFIYPEEIKKKKSIGIGQLLIRFIQNNQRLPERKKK